MKPDNKEALLKEIADLKRKLFEHKAQFASSAGAAFDSLPKAADYHASGVIIQITALGGKEVIPPVMIRDGLSKAAIKALQDDICRTFELATLVNPAMARNVPVI